MAQLRAGQKDIVKVVMMECLLADLMDTLRAGQRVHLMVDSTEIELVVYLELQLVAMLDHW